MRTNYPFGDDFDRSDWYGNDRGAVISDLNAKQKLGIPAQISCLKVSFLGPSLTFSVSKYQTLAGSADILSHLMEQYFNLTPGTEVQDSIAEG